MKNLTKLLGIIALVAVIGFAMAACEQPTNNTPTLTGITVNYTGGSVAINTDVNSLKSNLTVTAQYSNNISKTLNAADYSLSGDLSASGQKTITVTYEGKTTTFSVTVTPTGAAPTATLTGITATYTGTTTIYPTTPLNNLKTSLTVKAQYSDNSENTLNSADYSLSGNLSASGQRTITVTYEGQTTTFTVTVTAGTAPTLTGITLNTDSVKKVYTHNETLNLTGLVVTAAYSNSTSATVSYTSASPANGAALSTTGTTTVTVSYTEGGVIKTADFSVTVTPTFTGITAEYTGTSHVYSFTLRDSLKDHLTVKAQYSDGTSATLEAADYTLSGTLTAGTSTITVTYQSKTTTFDVTVTAATLDSIAVAFDQDDETIYTSAPLDNLKQYLTVTATYTFTGSEETHEETLSAHEYTLSGELTADPPTITVTYGGKTGTFTPTVTAVALVSITANYTGGDVEINSVVNNLKTALTVTAQYNDGSTPTVSEYTLDGDVTTIGQKTITASYTDGGVTKTATFNVTVVCTIHDWQWKPLTSATCTTAGSEIQTCSLCGVTGETRPTSIDPNAHIFAESYNCSLCNFSYNLGDIGPGGGKIFYRTETGFTMTDDNSTAHYLEAAPADMAETLRWAYYTPSNIAGTETAIGTGRKNTTRMLATDAQALTAKACNDYNNGNKTDWFLPSKDELNQLYVNRTSVGNMGTSYYWSSSQYNNNNNNNAWTQLFSDGSQTINPMGNPYSVRAVRAF
jgi:hypothetical protein